MTSSLGGMAGRAVVVVEDDVDYVKPAKVVLQGCIWTLSRTEVIFPPRSTYRAYEAAGEHSRYLGGDTKPGEAAPFDGSGFSGVNPAVSSRPTEPPALATISSWQDMPPKCHRTQELTSRLRNQVRTRTKDRAEYATPLRHL